MPAPDTAHTYPPPGHVLRQMELTVTPTGEGRAVVELPVWPNLLHPGGWVRTGVLATAVDVAGGVVAARAVHPDWIATAGLSIEAARGATTGPVRVEVHVLRAGRTAVVIDHRVVDDDGPVAAGTMTFTRLHRRDGNPDVEAAGPGGSTRFATDGPRDDRSLLEAVGVRLGAEGEVELDLTDVVRNSLGSVQGGMLGLVGELAAEVAAGRRLGHQPGGCWAADLAVDYVNVAKVGPVRAAAEVVRVDGPSARCRVRVVDVGAGGRLAALASATVVPVGR